MEKKNDRAVLLKRIVVWLIFTQHGAVCRAFLFSLHNCFEKSGSIYVPGQRGQQGSTGLNESLGFSPLKKALGLEPSPLTLGWAELHLLLCHP